MNYIASHLTAKLIQQINSKRIQLDMPVLWPDHEIMQFMDSDFDIEEILNKASAIKLNSKKIKDHQITEIIKDSQHTHFACKKNTQNSMIDIILSTRSIAIDEIKFYDRQCCCAWFRILQLSSKEHLWGCQIASQGGTQIIITPAQMSKKCNLIQFEVDKVKIHNNIIFYGTQRQPRYGRKIYDRTIPQHAFVIYQTKIQQLNSALDTPLQKQEVKQHFKLLFSNQKKSDAIKKVDKQENIIKNKRQYNQIVLNDKQDDKYQKDEIINIIQENNLYSLPSTKQNIFQRSAIDDLKQKYLTQYKKQYQIDQDCPQKENNYQFPEKQPQYLRLLSSANNTEFVILKSNITKFMTKENQKSHIFANPYYISSQSILLLDFIRNILTKNCIQQEIAKLQIQQLLQLPKICLELGLQTISQICIFLGILNKINSETWIDVYTWVFEYQKIDCNNVQIARILKQKVESFFICNSRQIFDKAHQVFYAKLLQISQQDFLELLFKAIIKQQPYNYKYASDVLFLLTEHFSIGKNVLELLVNNNTEHCQVLGYCQNSLVSVTYDYVSNLCQGQNNINSTSQKSSFTEPAKFWKNKQSFQDVKQIFFNLNRNQKFQENHFYKTQCFRFGRHIFQLILVLNNKNKLIVFLKYDGKSSIDCQYCPAVCQFKLSWKGVQKTVQCIKKMYFAWSPGNHYIPGVVFQLSTQNSTTYELSLKMSENVVDGLCLQFITMKAQELFENKSKESQTFKNPRTSIQRLSEQMNRRKSQKILINNILKQIDNFHIEQTQKVSLNNPLLQLSPITLFCLFQNEKLFINNQIKLIPFVAKYIQVSKHPARDIIILPIRFACISLDQLVLVDQTYPNLGLNKTFIKKMKHRINKGIGIPTQNKEIQCIDLHRRSTIQTLTTNNCFNSVKVIEWLQKTSK